MREKAQRGIFLLLGFSFIALAIVGVFLPLIPTTPFLILAALFFSKSSEKWHTWLLENKLFGPLLHSWEEDRCMPVFAKYLSLSMLLIFGSMSVVMLQPLWLQLVAVALVLYAVYFIINIQSCLTLEEEE